MTQPTTEQLLERVALLEDALQQASDHLDYCGYGDSYEREGAVAQKLPEKIAAALGAKLP